MSEPSGAEKSREQAPINRTDELIGLLSSRVVGQAHALDEEEALVFQRYDIPFLQKPFVAAELLSALEAISLSTGSIRSATG